MSNMNVTLFGLTGFGTAVLHSLLQAGHQVDLVVTRQEVGEYPYHAAESIVNLASNHSIKVLYAAEGERVAEQIGGRVLICCTYHRLLGPKLLSSFETAINIHPSLLPKYRGPSPCFWPLVNQEKETGVTAHRLTADFDAGPVITQRTYQLKSDETQGSLRQELATLSGQVAVAALMDIESGAVSFTEQDQSEATYFPKADYQLDQEFMSPGQREAFKRACLPWPGFKVYK